MEQTYIHGPESKRGVYRSQAMYVAMGANFQPGLGLEDLPINSPQEALHRARSRASWRWALRNPLGDRNGGL